MKRRDLIQYIESHGCLFLREGGNHTVYINPNEMNAISTVPRHREVKEFLVRKICRDLKILGP